MGIVPAGIVFVSNRGRSAAGELDGGRVNPMEVDVLYDGNFWFKLRYNIIIVLDFRAFVMSSSSFA